jgi:hypothetical protein
MIYHHQVVGQMAILDQNYVVPPLPAIQFADLDNPTEIEIMVAVLALATHLSNLQVDQVNALAAFQAAMNQPLPPAAPLINVQLPQCNA